MSSTEKEKKFYEMADRFIATANKLSKQADQGTVSATFLYAAARFNTFLVASASSSQEEFSSRKEEVLEYFMAEYKKMLEEHFADYHDNFDKYIGSQNQNIQ
jgi:DNA repair protein RadC